MQRRADDVKNPLPVFAQLGSRVPRVKAASAGSMHTYTNKSIANSVRRQQIKKISFWALELQEEPSSGGGHWLPVRVCTVNC